MQTVTSNTCVATASTTTVSVVVLMYDFDQRHELLANRFVALLLGLVSVQQQLRVAADVDQLPNRPQCVQLLALPCMTNLLAVQEMIVQTLLQRRQSGGDRDIVELKRAAG